jgi:fatty acyl-CoA reductase
MIELNKTVGITGGTGFLATALIEALLRKTEGSKIVLLIRPGKRLDAKARAMREIFKNDCFDELRKIYKDAFDDLIEKRVRVVSGDISKPELGLSKEEKEVFGSVDVLVHSAATVSFDAPLDQAVSVNLLGPKSVAEFLIQSGSKAHFISVSTAYVSGSHRGEAREEVLDPFGLNIIWESEVEFGKQLKKVVEFESLLPKNQELFLKEAKDELGAAGRPLLAEKAENLREEWIKNRLIEAGKARAKVLGFPDVYAYSKALGEKALLLLSGKIDISIVRPSIIEASLSEPKAGWIKGFRMADPIIISYARGLLNEFPGIPEGIIDVIPVDFVVSCIIGTILKGPDKSPKIYHCSSGDRNPLKYKSLVDFTQDYFLAHPIYDSKNQPIVVPDWSFPGRRRVEKQLKVSETILKVLENVLVNLPLRNESVKNLENKRQQIKRALGYVQLYGSYTESEAVFKVDNLLELAAFLKQQYPEINPDPIDINWQHYLQEVYLPSVVTHARAKSAPRKKAASDKKDRSLDQILSKDRQLAVFDLENTLIASNVVDAYSWFATKGLNGQQRALFSLKLAAQGPRLLMMDKADRGDFLRYFYRKYAGADAKDLEKKAMEFATDFLLKKAFPEAIYRVRIHKMLGHKTVLITGALDFIVKPLAPLFDEIFTSHMGVSGSKLTGDLKTLSPIAEARAIMVREYASQNSIDLTEAVAYGDSTSDLALLESVGFPVAVNPEPKLLLTAEKRGWRVEYFKKAGGTPFYQLPWAPPIDETFPGPVKSFVKVFAEAVFNRSFGDD